MTFKGYRKFCIQFIIKNNKKIGETHSGIKKGIMVWILSRKNNINKRLSMVTYEGWHLLKINWIIIVVTNIISGLKKII